MSRHRAAAGMSFLALVAITAVVLVAAAGPPATATAGHSHDDLLKLSTVTGWALKGLAGVIALLVSTGILSYKTLVARNTEWHQVVERTSRTATQSQDNSDKIKGIVVEMAELSALVRKSRGETNTSLATIIKTLWRMERRGGDPLDRDDD